MSLNVRADLKDILGAVILHTVVHMKAMRNNCARTLKESL